MYVPKGKALITDKNLRALAHWQAFEPDLAPHDLRKVPLAVLRGLKRRNLCGYIKMPTTNQKKSGIRPEAFVSSNRTGRAASIVCIENTTHDMELMRAYVKWLREHQDKEPLSEPKGPASWMGTTDSSSTST